jgi:hypothetical protein
MEIKLTENERQQLKKAYECLYHLNKNMVDLEDCLRNVGWPFAGISPEDYQSKARFIPAKNFADLPFTEKMSLLYFSNSRSPYLTLLFNRPSDDFCST